MKQVATLCLSLVCLPAFLSAQTASGPARERLTLDGAIRTALENNRQIQSSRLDVDRADDQIAIAKTRRLPSFSTEMQASQLLSPVDFSFPHGAFGEYAGIGPIPSSDMTFSVPRQPTFYVAATVAQPLTQLHQINLGVRAATTTSTISRERLRGREQALVNDVKRLYFAVLQTETAISASDEAIAFYRELDRTLQARIEQRVALRSDGLDVQYKLAQERLTRVSLENTLSTQKEQINQLLGRDVTTAFDVDEPTSIALADVDVDHGRLQALEQRADLREARLKVEQADLERRTAKAERIPEISLAAGYLSNFNMDVMPQNLATFGVRMKWEPFDWGRRGRDVASKTKVVRQAEINAAEIRDRALIEVNSRFRTLSERRALLEVARAAQASTRERLREKTNQFQVKAALLSDLLQLRAELAARDDRYQQAMSAFWTAKADYDLAVGEEGVQ